MKNWLLLCEIKNFACVFVGLVKTNKFWENECVCELCDYIQMARVYLILILQKYILIIPIHLTQWREISLYYLIFKVVYLSACGNK